MAMQDLFRRLVTNLAHPRRGTQAARGVGVAASSAHASAAASTAAWTAACAVGIALASAERASAQFFHFESPHIHPLELTPDGSRLLAVNTVDQRLEVFDVVGTAPYLVPAGSVVVGVEPISVRARTSSEAWVVNHMSDSVTVVDLNTMSVKATLLTGDEPCDVVFAGKLQRAFVSVSQLNRVEVFDPSNLLAAPSIVNIAGEDPRGLATDGVRVYAVIAECGNDTTIVPETKVSSTVNPYPNDQNPPPNSGSTFSPPVAAGLPTAPRSGLIVRKDSTGAWKDDNNGNWSSAVTWGLNGNDVAIINANNLATTYARGFMTSPLAITMAPDGRVVTVGTEAKNEIRFEPNLRSKFVRVEGAVLPAGGATTVSSRFDLNPHLTYAVPSIPMMQRLLSVGDPRSVVVSANGAKAYVTGMGSSNLIAFSMSNFARLSLANVGEGPTGVVLDAAAARLYTLNRFDGSISVVDESSFTQIGTVPFYDPTPNVVKIGRPFVFDTHIASGLGQVSCNSCHIDSRMDQLAWDLGDPSGQVKVFNESCNLGLPGQAGACGNWHPM
ncbi:MAG: YncE family protein, partial [Planctomycetota bacterium]